MLYFPGVCFDTDCINTMQEGTFYGKGLTMKIKQQPDREPKAGTLEQKSHQERGSLDA